MRIDLFRKYSLFSFFSVLLTLGLLIFSTQTNYFFKNFVFVSIIFTTALIYFSGIYRSGMQKWHLSALNIIDVWFFADLLYNVFSISYSQMPRVSIEECFFQTAYFLVYIIMRFFVLNNISSFERTLKFVCVISFGFVLRILYISLYKFEMIGSDGRIYHDSMHPNLLASFILMALSCFVYLLFKNILMNLGRFRIVLVAVPICFYTFTIFMTSSRGGMLGILLASFFISFLYLKRTGAIHKFKYVVALIAFAAFLFIAFNYQRVYNLFWETSLSALKQRGQIWIQAAQVFKENPVFGVGASAYTYVVQKVSSSSMVDAHNFMLQKLCDLGVVGTFIYLMPLLLVFRRAVAVSGAISSEENVCASAMGYSVIFLLISVFVNSSLSPHYILPTLSLYLYMLMGIFVSIEQMAEVKLSSEKNEDTRFLVEILFIAFLSALFYTLFKLFSLLLPGMVYFELYVWAKPLSLFFGAFAYSFYLSGKFKVLSVKLCEEELYIFNAPSRRTDFTCKFSLVVLVLLTFTMTYHAANYFIAEKANNLAMGAASTYSMKKACEYFDIAIRHDDSNIAYLINKSYLLFMAEMIRNKKLAGNKNIKEALELVEKCVQIFPYDELLKSANIFLHSKYKDDRGTEAAKSDRKAKTLIGFNADINEQMVIQAPFNAFSKYVDVFGDEGYSTYIKANEGLRKKILDIMYEEKDIRPGTRLTPYFDYITFTLAFAINLDFPNIDKFLISGVNAAMKNVDTSTKYLPVAGYKEHTLTYLNQMEIISTMASILPVVWKYSSNMSSSDMKKKMEYMFGSDSLFPIVDYFLFNNDKARTEFLKYDPPLRDYLESMAHFSNGSFEIAVKNQEVAFKKNKGFAALNSSLMSWIYYKVGDINAARDILLYSQTHTLNACKRDLTYKRDLLYGGNFHGFYYLPFQTYYNEFIMLALIRLNHGDHSKVVYEVFKYLRTVMYVDR